jgi:KaiC/GvpD/RAD55 family RecA-like ATPase
MLEPIRQKNKFVQDAADKFMKGSNSDHAQHIVKERIEEFKDKGMTRQETINWLAKRGYLKTETDRKIVEGELNKAKVFSSNRDDWEYKQRLSERVRRQSLVNQITSQMAIEGQKERRTIIDKIKNKRSRYY